MVDTALLPDDEEGRLAAIRRYDILDTPPDGTFDRITALAARLFGVPIAIVSIVDSDRIWFKSHHGLDVDQIDREPGLCASAILHDGPWLVEDAAVDPRTLANPLVAGDFGLRFYAGVPLRTGDGYSLGTLCVIDRERREATEAELATLADLAAVVVDELELRLSARRTVSLENELRIRAESLATALQQSLVPPALPAVDGLEMVARYHVAQRDVAGGDFFDVAPADWGTAVIVGDACGKGPEAAAAAATARWSLRSLMTTEPDPALALERLNSLLRPGSNPDARYVTGVAASLVPTAGGATLDLAVGGHPLPLLVRAGTPDGPATVEALGRTGPLLGWFPDTAYRTDTVDLHHGDTLLLFTDGLLEAVAGVGETDDAALRALIADSAGAPVDRLADRLDGAIGEDRRDDAAFLIVRVR